MPEIQHTNQQRSLSLTSTRTNVIRNSINMSDRLQILHFYHCYHWQIIDVNAVWWYIFTPRVFVVTQILEGRTGLTCFSAFTGKY